MSEPSSEPGTPGPRLPSAIERASGPLAVAGGLLMIAVALLATTSVLLRWLLNAPIEGDFELVKMATAIAIFSFLPYTQAQRGNIMIDTFTGWLPEPARIRIDAAWDIAYGALIAYVAWCLAVGAIEALQSGETTMQRQLLIWPSIALSAALAAFLALTALAGALRRIGRSARRGGP